MVGTANDTEVWAAPVPIVKDWGRAGVKVYAGALQDTVPESSVAAFDTPASVIL